MSWLDKVYPDSPIPRMAGESKYTMAFLIMLATTFPIKTDEDWWQVRIMILNWRN